jgi:predicted PurR-regulated permease PerM
MTQSAPTEPVALHRAIIGAVAVVALVAAAFASGIALYRVRVVVVAAVAALMLATLLEPIAAWLRAHRFPASVATSVVLAGAGAILGLIGIWVIPQLWSGGSNLGPTLSKVGHDLSNWLANGPLHLTTADLRQFAGKLGLTSGGGASPLLRGLVGGAVTVAELVEGTVLVVVFSAFLITRGEGYLDWAIAAVPSRYRARARTAGRTIWETMAAYVRGVALNGAVNAILLGAALGVLRIPLAAPLTVVAFVGGFFPVVGTVSAGVLAAVIALATKGLGAAVLVAIVTAVLHHIELYVAGPLILGRWVRLHPTAVVAAIAIGWSVAGAIGIFLAPPALAVGLGVNRSFRELATGTPEEPR